MIIKTLTENTAVSEGYRTEHGLSLYIETREKKILFDLGESDLFAENAMKMGVNIADVDYVIISHGHIDHGGGLECFLEKNTKAKIYLHEKAFEKHFSYRQNEHYENIGLDEEIKQNDRFVFLNEYFLIDEGIELFSGIKGKELISLSNRTLYTEKDGMFVQDTFEHEQNLIISEDDTTVLFAGCAHNGIVNIISRFIAIKNKPADHVIGGFHLSNSSAKTSEAPALVNQIAARLKTMSSQYYTCHCTGMEAYLLLNNMLGDQIQYLATGSVLKL